MKSLGIDTSNYSTSVAVTKDAEVILSKTKLLPVSDNSHGLRQSDAVFLHTKQLGEIAGEAIEKNRDIEIIGVSEKPECREDSYMPCFLPGITVAEILGKTLDVPVYKFSHQQGHIASALLGSERLDLFDNEFIAFHLSGGTSKAIMVTPEKNIFKTEIISKSLDLNAGQVIDRVGGMMNIKFPAGEALDRLSLNGEIKKTPKVCIKENDFCLSGLENQCRDLINQNESKENVALYCISFICETVCRVTEFLKNKYGDIPFVYAGGVTSNTIIKKRISEQFGGIFAPGEYSKDNAMGIALLAERMKNNE